MAQLELFLKRLASLFADATSRGVEKSVSRRLADPDADVNASVAVPKRPARRSTKIDPMLKACGYVGAGWLIGMKAGRKVLSAPGPLHRARRSALAKGDEVFNRYAVYAIFLTPSWVAVQDEATPKQ